jgi:L-iditol 2-dehydrogenase
MKNKVAYMTGIREMEIREEEIPSIKNEEVLIKVEYVGICGSDVHYYENGKIGNYVVNGNFVLGHEMAGKVVKVGKDVKGFKINDKVTVEPGLTCGKCEYCKTGQYNLCLDVRFLATPPYHGCFKTYIAYPSDMVYKLPENITTKEGALIEPLCVGLEATKTAEVTLGTSVIILGAGCIGLTTLLAVKAFGATEIVVVDIIEKRLKKALELGATRVVNALGKSFEDVKNEINLEADVVFETAGAEATTQETVDFVKRGGKIVLVGLTPKEKFEFNFSKLMDKVAEIKTIFRYKNLYSVAIKAIADGKINISKIVTDEYDFEDIKEAFEKNIKEKNDVVKAIIKI